jgi:hypothetical protein
VTSCVTKCTKLKALDDKTHCKSMGYRCLVEAAGIEPISKSTIFLNHLRASVSPYSLQNVAQNVAKLNLMGRQITMEGTRIGKGILKYFQSGGAGLGKP